MSRRLHGEALRVFGRHDRRQGQWYRQHLRELKERFQPSDAFTFRYTSSVAAARVNARSDPDPSDRLAGSRAPGILREPARHARLIQVVGDGGAR